MRGPIICFALVFNVCGHIETGFSYARVYGCSAATAAERGAQHFLRGRFLAASSLASLAAMLRKHLDLIVAHTGHRLILSPLVPFGSIECSRGTSEYWVAPRSWAACLGYRIE